jgi:hypothetical protein
MRRVVLPDTLSGYAHQAYHCIRHHLLQHYSHLEHPNSHHPSAHSLADLRFRQSHS